MDKHSRRVRRRIECPEGSGNHELLVKLLDGGGKEAVRAISCDNPDLEVLLAAITNGHAGKKFPKNEADHTND